MVADHALLYFKAVILFWQINAKFYISSIFTTLIDNVQNMQYSLRGRMLPA